MRRVCHGRPAGDADVSLTPNVRSPYARQCMSRPLATEMAELQAADVDSLSPREFAAHMVAWERVRARVDAEMLRRTARFELSGAFEVDCAANPVQWITAQTGTARVVAASRVRLARNLQLMPLTAAALADGLITESHARVLARCVANPRVRDAFTESAEDELLEVAESCSADELSNIVDQWIRLVDQDGPEPHAPEHDTLRANQVGDRVKVDGDFGLETGLPLLKAIEERGEQLFHRDAAVTDANPDDGLASRTPGQRRAEALVDLVLRGAGAEANPQRREPLFLVHVDEETFRFGNLHPDTLLELDDGTPIPIDIMERWRCGSRFQTLVLDASRAVLFLGRTQRYANREIRRALAARDRGCGVPGCTRPPEMCDAHHVVWWENLGETDVDKMVLLCRHHHRMIHAGKLDVEMVDGVPRFFDADGQLLVEGRRRPPNVWAA